MQCPRALPVVLLAARLLADADSGTPEWALVKSLGSHRGMRATAFDRKFVCYPLYAGDRDAADMESLAAYVTVCALCVM